jgi:hypothetical protein
VNLAKDIPPTILAQQVVQPKYRQPEERDS